MRKQAHAQPSKPHPERAELHRSTETIKLDALENALAHPEETLGRSNDLKRWNIWFWRKLKEDREAMKSFKRLFGPCDVDLMLYCLWVLGQGPNSKYRPKDTWRHAFAFDRRELLTVAKTLRKAANCVEKLNKAEVTKRYLLIAEVRGEVSRVPWILRAYATLIAPGPKRPKMRPKDAPVSSIYRAILISHVREKTEHFHDRDLANLYRVAACRNDSDLTENWADWRKDHKELIKPH